MDFLLEVLANDLGEASTLENPDGNQHLETNPMSKISTGWCLVGRWALARQGRVSIQIIFCEGLVFQVITNLRECIQNWSAELLVRDTSTRFSGQNKDR